MNPSRPYIGITGVVTSDDVETIRLCVEALRLPSHRLMAGVLVSRKTLTHDVTTNRRYPGINVVNDLLDACADFRAWPVVHYNTRSEGDVLAAELEFLVGGCPSMQGLQLNVVTPDHKVVKNFTCTHPGIEVILQVNGSSLKATGLTPLQYAMGYQGVRHVLLDGSGGNGRELDIEGTVKVIQANTYGKLKSHGVHLGVAGGLGPDCCGKLVDLAARLSGYIGPHDDKEPFYVIDTADLSFDAESGVRIPVSDPIEGEPYQDQLDRGKALEYVDAVCKVLG